MSDIFDSIDYINKKNGEINIFNIFIFLDPEINNSKFGYFFDYFKKIYTFKNLSIIFNEKILSIINYIKIYSVIDFRINYILFNDKYFNTFDKIVDENKLNKLDNIKIKVEENGEQSNQLINFLAQQKNFLTNFILKQNNKSKLSSRYWLKNIYHKNKENKKINTDHIIKTDGFTIKKKINTEIIIKNERISSTLRLALPNDIIISFNDGSYISLNKIIISKTLNAFSCIFTDFGEKLRYILNLYKIIFNIDLIEDATFSYNISFKIKNEFDLFNNIFLNIDENVKISEKYINIKYIRSKKDLIKYDKLLQSYKQENILFKQDLLSYSNQEILYSYPEIINSFFIKCLKEPEV